MKYQNEITGRVIRELRKKRGVTQEVLSGFACISRSHLAMIENGTKNPNVDTLWRIAEALGMTLSDLLVLIETEIAKEDR